MIIQSTWISYIHYDPIIEHIKHNQNSKSNLKHLNGCLQVVIDLKHLINAWLTKSGFFRRPFPFPKRYCGRKSDKVCRFHQICVAYTEIVSYTIPLTRTNINHIYISIYTDFIIIIWSSQSSLSYNLYMYIKINTSYMTIIKHARIYNKTKTYKRIKTFLQVALMPVRSGDYRMYWKRRNINKLFEERLCSSKLLQFIL